MVIATMPITSEQKREYDKERYKNHKNQILEQTKIYYENHKEQKRDHYKNNKAQILQANEEYRLGNKEKINKHKRDYYENNKEEIQRKKKEYRLGNKEKINVCSVQKRKENPEFKVKWYLRARLNAALKHNSKLGSAVADLGMIIFDFKKYLEQRFYLHPVTDEAMTWENYGKSWEIDHIKALCLFDLTDTKQFLEAVHFSNLQPLWKEDHQKKTAQDMKEYTKETTTTTKNISFL